MDAVGFLTLGHLFVAHMTGNASKLGVALAHGRLGDALPLLLAPILYVAGIAAGTVLLDTRSRRPIFAVQALLFAAFMAYGSTVIHGETGPGHTRGAFYVLEVLAILGFGLQTAAMTEIAGSSVRTTYLSGPLTTFAMTATRRLFGLPTRPAFVWLLFWCWVSYVVFATAGAYSLRELSVWCLAFPIAVLLAIASRAWPPSS